MFKNVASQKMIAFAFDATTNLPKTGDAANLTAYVSKDYGTVTVLGDTSATEMDATNAKGYYLYDLTQAETNADTLLFSAKSSTANIVVIGAPATVFTNPPNFTATSIDSNGRVDLIKVAGTTQTARDLGASVLLSSGTGTGQLSLSAGTVLLQATQTGVTIPTVTNLTNAPTAGDFTATMKTSIGTAVAASAVASVTGNVGGNVTGSVGSVTGAVASVTGNVGGNVTGSVGSVASGGITEASFATTAGGFKSLGIVDQGTAQAATGTTLQLRSAAAFADDELIGAVILINTATTGAGQARVITDYVGSTDTATVDTWTTTPTGTITYKVFGAPPGSATAPIPASLDATQFAKFFSVDSGTVYGSAVAGSVVKEIADNAGGSSLTVGAIADGVWDELLSGHAISGSAGAGLSAAGSAGDPWSTALPGAYGSGTAGKIIGDNINATISSRASPTNITAGTITTVTNLTNAPTAGDFTAAMKTSIGTAVAASAVASVTGNVGGNVTGSVGSVVGAVGSVTGAVGSVTGLTASNLDATVSSRLASAGYTAPDNTSITAIKAKTDNLPSGIQKNTALNNFEFLMVLTSDHYTAGTGLTITAQRSLDGAAFSACANSATEVSNGVYKINLAAGDLNANIVTLLFTATGADARVITLATEP